MSLYLQLVFALLTFELALFIVLVIPKPFKFQKKMFLFLSNNPIVSRAIYGLKILFIFVTVLFIDSLQHMLRVHNEGMAAKERGTRGDLRAETDWRSRKFLSERNFYLTGSTLFLALSLNRVYSLLLDIIKLQDELAVARTQKSTAAGGSSADKEKYESLKRDYDDLAAKYTASQGVQTSKKSD
ncbi:hypothetical protein P389DRAFT_196895 [Cystobasidium minutum MCA 4210]|uniref:uncharacterized protein n=1 Tax=Cystobasidium minutum MCA 4210 TaxID=1397322 RepID=UPI0034CE4F0C|eukprot:jgi/Rhomi1/196895/gm1.5109_g